MRRPRAAKRPLLDLNWGEELWKSNPQLFSISSLLSAVRNGHCDYQVESGQFWRVLPQDSVVDLYDERETRYCPGILTIDAWKPIARPDSGREVAKLFYCAGPPPTVDLSLRPGLLLGEPFSPKKGKASLLHYGRAVWVPGYSKGRTLPGEMFIRFRRELGIQATGSIQFWLSWGLEADNSGTLVAFMTEMRACEVIRGALPGETPHQTATRLLAEIMGAREPSAPRPPSSSQKACYPQRGEVVLVTFTNDQSPTPCLVVSPDEINAQGFDIAVCLQGVPYIVGDENNPLLTPLPVMGQQHEFQGRWSFSVASVRGLTRASRIVKRLDPPLLLQVAAADLFEDIVARLDFFYA